jgi:protein-L-isoaspartate O-methyltransferase
MNIYALCCVTLINTLNHYLKGPREHPDKNYYYINIHISRDFSVSKFRILKMNNDAELYSSYDHGQKVDVNYFLSTYWNLLKWKNNENVLYVGAATGDVTTEILLPRLPTNLKKIVGVDIVENLVSFAKRKFKHVSKANFVVLDIGCRTVPEEFYEHFDHIFSFNCLNWVPKER